MEVTAIHISSTYQQHILEPTSLRQVEVPKKQENNITQAAAGGTSVAARATACLQVEGHHESQAPTVEGVT
jgi:hypothetical protein